MPESHVKFHSVNGKRQILIIEDELINQQILCMMLGDSYDIICASTGDEALHAVSEHADMLSVVLLDLNLPDMHGLDLLQQLRDNPATAALPVIVMTADRDAEVESLSHGAIDFIPKPYPEPRVVQARVQRTIELSEDRDIIRWTERDKLTGLYNREYFYRYAASFDSYHKDIMTDAIVIDINHFHEINERYGKVFGDELLRRIGEKVRGVVNNSDTNGIVCRREGDTFLVYCPHRDDYDAILEHVAVDLPGATGDRRARVRLRMGVYPNTDKGLDIERRFDRAKLAADSVREGYPSQIGIYNDALRQTEIFEEQLLEDFPAALCEKQFQVYYQPKIDIRENEPMLSSAEALVRWTHPTLGMVSPGIFIPLFEKNGLVRRLDDYVWAQAARQVRLWREQLGMSIPVSINVSRVDMFDPFLVETMEQLVRDNGLEDGELLIEVTESAYTEDSEQIIRTVKRLREKGFRIEMDDFGSGYSSLNMLSTLPIDALKLDMQFIRNAFRERKDTRLLEVVIRLAESLDVPTIAEGVETAEQMLSLKSMGCDIVQGYYFSKPLPAEEFARFAAEMEKKKLEHRAGSRRTGRDQFTYDALHDPMTGLYNHTAFEILFHDSDQDHIAVLIAQIDDYDRLKKEHGAELADRAVLRVTDVLRSSFRSADDICRLKADEFVIIMTRMTAPMHPYVYEKISQVNAVLQQPQDELPPLSLSVGVAFSDRENPEGDIFQDADSALMRMKKMRNTGCSVY